LLVCIQQTRDRVEHYLTNNWFDSECPCFLIRCTRYCVIILASLVHTGLEADGCVLTGREFNRLCPNGGTVRFKSQLYLLIRGQRTGVFDGSCDIELFSLTDSRGLR
jgi:hypothetical protein